MADPAVQLRPWPAFSMLSVAASAPPLPRFPAPGRFVAEDDTTILSVAPGRWLLLRREEVPVLAAEVATWLGSGATIIDLTDAWAAWDLRGPGVREALSRVIPLDLHPRAMRPGQVAATFAAHTDVLLWQTGEEPAYVLACPRSLAADFAHHLPGG